jgi:hypothetical protein
MTSKYLNVSELDFDTIKINLKKFLQNEKNEKGELIFTDYDFEGSNLNVIIDLLAYNSHLMGFYANQLANESFLDTAKKRSSIVSRAKEFNYIPRSVICAKAEVLIYNSQYIEGDAVNKSVMFYGQAENSTVAFCVLNTVPFNKNKQTQRYECEVTLYQGAFTTVEYVKTYEWDKFFVIPNHNVDIDEKLLRVQVFPHENSEEFVEYTRAKSIIELNENSNVYFIQENWKGLYEIYFGNGLIGHSVPIGSVIKITYFITLGTDGNNITQFFSSDLPGKYKISVITSSFGGQPIETAESIQFLAPKNYEAQQRCVAKNDFITIMKTKYRTIRDISVWGGEEETPPQYGKVFMCLLPDKMYVYTEFQKKKIIQDLVSNYNIVTVTPVVVDPDYIFCFINVMVTYNSNIITVTNEELIALINSAIINYFDSELNIFNRNLIYNKLTRYIEDVHTSIMSCNIDFTLEKKFVHAVGTSKKYILSFSNMIKPGSLVSNSISINHQLYYIKDIPDSYENADVGTVVLYRPLQKYSIKTFTFVVGNDFNTLNTLGLFLPQYSTSYPSGDYEIKVIIPSIHSRKYQYTAGSIVNPADVHVMMPDQFHEVSTQINVYIPLCVGATVELKCKTLIEEIEIKNPQQGYVTYSTGEVTLNHFTLTEYTTDPYVKLSCNFGAGSNIKNSVGRDLTIYANKKNQLLTLSTEKSKVVILPR